MSKTVFNKIIAKLERLDEYLRYLADVQKVNKKSFLNDYRFYGLAERYLQLAIEVILDVGKLIIITEKLEKPEDNQGIFDILGNRKVLSKSLVASLRGIAGFRNILVHDYEKIDRKIVYEKLRQCAGDFKIFRRQIARFLR